jgi:hypothetical protein
MAHGKKKPDTPSKRDHMKNFDEAMQDALKNWSGKGDQPVTVTLQVSVSPNPGGVKEYHVIIPDS